MATSRRLFVQPALPTWGPEHTGTLMPLDADEMHYAKDVLRLKEGDPITLCDGRGYTAEAVLRVQGPKAWAAETQTTFAMARSLHGAPKIILACPMPKGERADWMAEKVAELGLYAWVWVVCERSVVLPKGANKKDRMLRLMRAAARQARHGRVPELLGPMPLEQHLHEVQYGPHSSRFVADGGGITAALAMSGGRGDIAHALVGPEGGLSPGELHMAQGAGYARLTLGPHILRVETAAMACAVLLGQANA